MRSSECLKIGIGRLNLTGSVVKLESRRLGFFVSGFQDRSPDLMISRDSGIQGFKDSMDVCLLWRLGVLMRPGWCRIRQEVSDSQPIDLSFSESVSLLET